MDREAAELLDRLVDGQRRVLGEDLVGTYLFGSLATGDFEPGISDVGLRVGDYSSRRLPSGVAAMRGMARS